MSTFHPLNTAAGTLNRNDLLLKSLINLILLIHRTWTIILINGKGNVDFIERTLKEPIDCTDENVKSNWIQSNHTFDIDN